MRSWMAIAVLFLPPQGWHFNRTGQERVADGNAHALPLSWKKGNWEVSTSTPQLLNYTLYLCRERGSRICSRVSGHADLKPGQKSWIIDRPAEAQ